MSLKPVHRGSSVELSQQRTQRFFTPWIVLYQLPVIETGMRNIAAAPARNTDFVQNGTVLFKNDNGSVGVCFRSRNGPEKTSGSATDNGNREEMTWVFNS